MFSNILGKKPRNKNHIVEMRTQLLVLTLELPISKMLSGLASQQMNLFIFLHLLLELQSTGQLLATQNSTKFSDCSKLFEWLVNLNSMQ